MDALGSLCGVAKDIVSGTGDGEDDIVFVDVEDPLISLVVFPSKARLR